MDFLCFYFPLFCIHWLMGNHILGNPASEIIVIAGIAIQRGYTVEEFQKSVFPHPTAGEIFHEALFS